MTTPSLTSADLPPSEHEERLRRRKRLVLGGVALTVVVATLASIVLRAHAAIVSYPGAGHDDGLFVGLAYSILNADWLGTFDKMTLAKGPAYPMFLALTGGLGIQAKIGEQLVYLAGSGLASYVLWLLTRSRLASLLLFLVLAFNPFAWTDHQARVIRDSLYLGLPLLFLSAVFWILLHRVRQPAQFRAIDLMAMAMVGVVGGFYWLTKEEGLWLAPSVLIVSLAAIWHALRAPDQRIPSGVPAGESARPSAPGIRGRVRSLVPVAAALVFAGLSGAAVLGMVAAMNWVAYGAPILNDFRDGNLPAAVGSMERIESGPRRRYVIVPEASRTLAYTVSPAAAELAPFLEGPLQGWVSAGCNVPSRFADDDADTGCDDFYAGWFYWAVRDAVTLAGHYGSVKESQDFLGRISAEIDQACEDGRLECAEKHDSVIPRIDMSQVREVLELVPSGLRILVDGGPIGYVTSEGAPESHAWLARITRGQLAPTPAGPPAVTVSGWVASRGPVPGVSVTSETTAFEARVSRSPGQDVEENYAEAGEPDQRASRFVVETDCLQPDCRLTVASGETRREFEVQGLAVGYVPTPAFDFNVDAVTYAAETRDPVTSTPRHPAWLQITRNIQGAYRVVLPIALILAVGGVLLGILITGTRRRLGAVIVVALACGVAVLTRISLVALIEVTSWPGALVDGYLGPASPFLLVGVVSGLYLLVAAVGSLVHSRRSPMAAPIDGPHGP